jgi:hypothetical protein
MADEELPVMAKFEVRRQAYLAPDGAIGRRAGRVWRASLTIKTAAVSAMRNRHSDANKEPS